MSKRRFSKTEWVALGLSELSKDGADAVKLEAICRAAHMTRGSFYHHFDDHQSFLTCLATQWLASQTTDVAQVVAQHATPTQQSDALTDAAVQIDYRLELGMRELARRVPDISAIVKEADARRLDILTTIYQARFGLDHPHAQRLAFLEYAAFSGVILIDPDMSVAQQKSIAETYDTLIVNALGRTERT